MKSISISVSDTDYEVFRQVAKGSDHSIAGLIREAMAYYKEQRLSQQGRLRHLTIFPNTRSRGTLPNRSQIYDEMAARHKTTP